MAGGRVGGRGAREVTFLRPWATRRPVVPGLVGMVE